MENFLNKKYNLLSIALTYSQITFMTKKCIICEEKEAKYAIKDSNEVYCEDCAKEHFADISLLVKVEDQAKKLKALINEKTQDEEEIL